MSFCPVGFVDSSLISLYCPTRAQNFGLTFRLVQLGVVNRPSRLEGFAFKDDGDDDMPAAGGAMDTSDAADAVDAAPVEEEF